jgi:hypothetical protein
MEESIQIDPSKPEGIQRLRDIIANGGSGMVDLVWGPELNFMSEETIREGLGIPESGTDFNRLDKGIQNIRLWGNLQKGTYR